MRERRGYVYILHFEQPLHHARHYVGCTCNPRERFIAHACGRGARIVQAALEAGIRFKVGAIGVTHVRGLRRIERHLKDWHGVEGFCNCCEPDAQAIPGTAAFPVAQLPFPLWSDALRTLAKGEPKIEYRYTSGTEPMQLTEEVRELMRVEKDCLGYIPAGGLTGISGSIVAGRMAICRVDGELAGYCAWTVSDVVRVHQCVVDDRFRGWGIGRRLVAMACEKYPDRTVQAKVREDLPANEFWRAIGFHRAQAVTHETSGFQLNLYMKEASQ